MQPTRLSRTLIVWCAVVFAAICQTAVARNLCVNPAGSHNCFSSIQTAVNHAAANDLIQVEAGTYKEEVVIGIPLAIIGAGAHASIIDATGLAHGIFVDGFDHPGLMQVTITGLTVENALFEGILVVSASDITIQDNNIIDNDATPSLGFTGAPSVALASLVMAFMRMMKQGTAAAPFIWSGRPTQSSLATSSPAMPMAF